MDQESAIAEDLRSQVPQEIGIYRRDAAVDQLKKFYRQANRQLACMAMLAGTRTGERNGVALMQGRLAEPGTGLPLCTMKEVEEYALMQLQLIPDWSG